LFNPELCLIVLEGAIELPEDLFLSGLELIVVGGLELIAVGGLELIAVGGLELSVVVDEGPELRLLLTVSYGD
jgi:hypothetical protein